MPAKLSTTVSKIQFIPNPVNAKLITQYHDFMVENRASERHQNNNLKIIIAYATFLGPNTSFYDVCERGQIISFLDTRKRNFEKDPDGKWITTWNDYLHRIKHFIRWLHNRNKSDSDQQDWRTPSFALIKEKKTNRLSPYSESEIWDRDELLSIIHYESYSRNKAALALLWDLDARNHEITALRIKDIRFRENYAEGEIPHSTKTGGGPILLTFSFPYVRDWLNKHPFRNTPTARLICNLNNGSPVSPDSLQQMMHQLKERIVRMLENNSIGDKTDAEKLQYLITNKRWNPYCIRHSAITYDSDYLPEYAVKKKARWSMNSRQGARYIKHRMGNDLKQRILVENGIISQASKSPSVLCCPRCNLVNTAENKYCSGCSYPLIPSAFDEIKENENQKFKLLEQKLSTMQSIMENLIANLSKTKDQQQLDGLAQSLFSSGALKCVLNE